MQHEFTPYTKESGQGGLVAIAMTILVAMAVVGLSLAELSKTTATRTVANKQATQAYYIAMSGIQEALATRMVPKSNYYNFTPTGYDGTAPDALFPQSGGVYNTVGPTSVLSNPASYPNLLGVYQYFIVGGDGTRKTDGTNRLTTGTGPDDTFPPDNKFFASSYNILPSDSPFIIFSKGSTCKSVGNTSVVRPGLITPSVSMSNVSCAAGSVLDEIVVVAVVGTNRMDATGTAIRDQIISTAIYKDPAQVSLPAGPGLGNYGAFIPGVGWRRNSDAPFSFASAWNATTASDPTNSLALRRVIFFDFLTGSILDDVDVTGATANANVPIPSDTSIMLVFQGGDLIHSSISGATPWNQDLADCKTSGTADNCAVWVEAGGLPVATGIDIQTITPAQSKLVFVPTSISTVWAPPGTPTTIHVNTTQMWTWNNHQGTTDYQVNFTMAPP